MPTVTICGVPVHRLGYDEVLAALERWIAAADAPGRARQVCTVNPEFVVDAQRDRAFHAVLRDADLCVADGVGIVWAARLLGKPVPERVTGSDGIRYISARAAQAGWRVYFLGAAPGVAAQAAAILQAESPGLVVAGTWSGSPSASGWQEIEAQLRAANADLLFVAFGHPKQDFWIHAHRQRLPVKVAIGVGGAFDFVAGVSVRAPRWMQRLGIEWLHRLLTQPWRWRRMLKLPLFVGMVLRQRFAGDNWRHDGAQDS